MNIMRKNILNSHRKSWDYFLVILFVLASGSVFWSYLIKPAGAFLLLALCGWINAKYLCRNGNGNLSYKYIIWIIALCLLNFLLTQSPYQDNSMLGYIVSIFAAYIVMSRFNFIYFVKLLTDVVFYIILFGIPIYLLATYEYLPVYAISGGGISYKLFLIYTIGWPEFFYRYSGIWHEPGACQIFLNTVLWLNYDKIRSWTLTKSEKRKFIVIVIGLLLTQSTGGYLVFMTFVLAVIMNSRLKVRNKRIVGAAIILLGIAVIGIMFMNPVIQAKLFETEGVSVSKADRLNDIQALWKMIQERPILGYGIGTNDFWTQSHRYGNYTCSAGLLTYIASLGLPWLIITSYYCYKSVRRLNYGMATWFLLASIVMMQMNEKFIEYPITSIFIFRFYSYNFNRR